MQLDTSFFKWFGLCLSHKFQELEAQANEQGDEQTAVKINPSNVIKPLHKLVGDHKDVVKIVIQLQSIISTIKPEIGNVLKEYECYSHLWDKVGLYKWSLKEPNIYSIINVTLVSGF